MIKYGFYEYKCKQSYIHNKVLTRSSRVRSIQNSIFVPILSVNDYIPADFFTAAIFKKLIFTNNQYIKNMYNYSNVIYNDFSLCKYPHKFKDTNRDDLQKYVMTHDLYTHRIHDMLQSFQLYKVIH